MGSRNEILHNDLISKFFTLNFTSTLSHAVKFGMRREKKDLTLWKSIIKIIKIGI